MAWEKTDDWKKALEPIGMIEYFRDMQVPDGIEGVLADGNWEVIFHQYAQAEYAAENVDFLRAVRVFEASGDLNQAAEIYKEFVADAAPRQVNLKATVRVPLDEIFGPDQEGIGPPSVFDGAKDEILKMISVDTFPRFKASAVKAQQAMGDEVDWDNIDTRDRSEAAPAAAAEAPPAPAAPVKKSIFAKKPAQ
jgi:hypothetical protein